MKSENPKKAEPLISEDSLNVSLKVTLLFSVKFNKIANIIAICIDRTGGKNSLIKL